MHSSSGKDNNESAPTDKLEAALDVFIGEPGLANGAARVLIKACEAGSISFADVEKMCGAEAEDVLLVCWEWRLLVPVRSAGCGEWDDRLLVMDRGEIYEPPNVVTYLVQSASRTGRWDPGLAVSELFSDLDEGLLCRLPDFLKKIGLHARSNIINAFQIRQARTEANLEEDTDTLIALLKSAGVISPKLRAMAEVAKAGSPVYEINPCVFVS